MLQENVSVELKEVLTFLSAFGESLTNVAEQVKLVQDAIADTRSVMVLHCQGSEDKLEAIGGSLEKHLAKVEKALSAACDRGATLEEYQELHEAIENAANRMMLSLKKENVSEVIQQAVDRALEACLSMREEDVSANAATLEQLRVMASGLTSLQQDMTSIRSLVETQFAEIEQLHMKLDDVREMLSGFSSDTTSSFETLMLRQVHTGSDTQEVLALLRDLSVCVAGDRAELPNIMQQMEYAMREMFDVHCAALSTADRDRHEAVLQRLQTISGSLTAQSQYTQEQLSMLQENVSVELKEVLTFLSAFGESLTNVAEQVKLVQDAIADTRSVMLVHCQGSEDKLEAIGGSLEKHLAKVEKALSAACDRGATLEEYQELHEAIENAANRMMLSLKKENVSEVIQQAV